MYHDLATDYNLRLHLKIFLKFCNISSCFSKKHDMQALINQAAPRLINATDFTYIFTIERADKVRMKMSASTQIDELLCKYG